jgi:CheY-like chemotaxis protein
VRVRGDAVRLIQVISNLLSNAGKYTDSGGRVRLSVTCTNEEAIVTVADSGIGIPEDMLGRVFDLFTQVQNARERSKGGIGIGLTLVKRLVEMHGGAVHASSAGEGCGSQFVLRFPLFADAGGHIPTGSSSPQPAPTGEAVLCRILIADDNVDAAESLQLLLSLQGHEVEVVHDGIQAMSAAERLNPDVVLLDIGLPGLDGLEVARRLRKRHGGRGPLLVAVTGLGREEDRKRTAEAGFDHHLVKPIDHALLESLLDGNRERGQSTQRADGGVLPGS